MGASDKHVHRRACGGTSVHQGCVQERPQDQAAAACAVAVRHVDIRRDELVFQVVTLCVFLLWFVISKRCVFVPLLSLDVGFTHTVSHHVGGGV